MCIRDSAITAGTSIDPVGRDGENDNQIPRTFDGNPATRWQSENYYADPRWEAGPNRSVGLAFRLTQPTTLRAVQLTFPASPGQSGVIYVADEPAIAGATKAGEFSDATGSTEVALTGAPQASYAVSYTHLDVYKRQSPGCTTSASPPIPCW